MRLLVLAALLPFAAAAQPSTGADPALAERMQRMELAERARMRQPQPVRAGDLVGRLALDPSPQQTVRGRVTGVLRDAEGRLQIRLATGGVLGFGTREVDVPADATALLGQFVVVADLDRDALRRLPPAAGGTPVDAEDRIRIGLTKN